MATRTGSDVAGALAVLSRASRGLAAGAALEPTLDDLVDAAFVGTGADAAVVWLPRRGDVLSAAAVSSVSAGLAAELEGAHAPSTEEAVALVAARLGGPVETLAVPVETLHGAGVLLLARRGDAFGEDDTRLASLAADLIVLAARLGGGTHGSAAEGDGALDIAADALGAAADDEGAAARIARLAALAAGAEGALVWRIRGDEPVLDGAFGTIDADAAARAAATAVLREADTAVADADASGRTFVTLQLGQPPLGALQLRFARERRTGAGELERLTRFAVRAAHALRAAERARDAAGELDRTRALLAVVGDAISRLSLSHTLDTAIDRVAALLDVDRVAIYLREDDAVAVAASRGVEGPHELVAATILAAALGDRRGGVLELPNHGDERLAPARAELDEAGIESVLALPLVVADAPIGLLAVYPRELRPLTEGESALLSALAVQLAVAVQNARLHERATALGRDLETALASEREAAKRLNAQYEISRSFAQSLSLDETLKSLAQSVVTLLGVDAAVIRVPDERGAELIPRAIHVNDERVDDAARALLLRPQPFARRDLAAWLERRTPFLLDADRAEELGGALGLLAPFLRKGSSAAVIPIATGTELLATLTIVSLHPGRPVAGEVADTAFAIAGQAALAVDNARLYAQQKAFADTMQRSLLPRAAPTLEGLELGAKYQSAARLDVGGDVYDYLSLEDGRLAVVLGDVTGHGVDAAADMAMAKYVFRSLAREHLDPGAFLAAANDVVSSEIAPGRFITMAALLFDAKQSLVSCAGAGHPPPRLVLREGAVVGIDTRGLALGIDAPQEYEAVTHEFPPGALVVAYTDGVVEARRGGEQFGVERLDELLIACRDLAPQEVADAALAACRDWTGGELADDFALVAIKHTA